MTVDTKTMNLNFGEGEPDRLKDSLRRMGEFIAYFEVAEERMAEWKKDIEETVQQHQEIVNNQLAELRETAEDLRGIMSEAGVARWRIAAEETLKQGKEHLKLIQAASDNHVKTITENNDTFKKLAHKSFDRLDRASAYTIKNISEAVSSFRITDFQRLTEQSCEIVEETSKSAIGRLRNSVKWFHWKNIGLAVAVAVFASMTIGLYLNDEMPWEIHKQVVAQRNAGQALINAWPTLSQAEQQRIIQYSKKAII